VRRREFISLLGGAAAWPLAARAQLTMPVVGFLNSASADGYRSMANAFSQGLKEMDYVVGRNVAIEYRWADDQYDRIPTLATDLVRQRVNVVFANGPSVASAQAATTTIPIIFLTGDDPVLLGFVATFNRPGGNATGIAILSGELASKRLELLHELVPHASTIAVLINYDYRPVSQRFKADIEAAAHALGLTIRSLQTNNEREIIDAFNTFVQNRPGALLVGPGPFLDSRVDLLISLAAQTAIPAAYETRAAAVAGGLVSYGADVGDGYRQAGIYTGRVLKGENPADLPVFRATKFELVINLKTAKALRLDVPLGISAGADEVRD
jgi:ABC-type uncharacterized transport system substrate-binding protein